MLARVPESENIWLPRARIWRANQSIPSYKVAADRDGASGGLLRSDDAECAAELTARPTLAAMEYVESKAGLLWIFGVLFAAVTMRAMLSFMLLD
jgi:hypothetical protein